VHREAGIVKWEKRARGRERVGEGTIFLIVPKRFKYNFNRISNCFLISTSIKEMLRGFDKFKISGPQDYMKITL